MSRPVMAVRRARGAVIALCALLCLTGVSSAAQELVTSKGCSQIPARIVKRLSVPRCYHEGLYYDGTSLWLANGEGGKIWVIDTATGAILSEIEPVAGFNEAVTAKGDGTYYTSEWYEKKVYRVRLDGKRLAVESSVSVAPSHPAGVLWTGRCLYVILWDRGLLGTRFSIAEMDEAMNIVNRVPVRAMQEPCQLAWDGTHLWITSWYDKRAYKVDIATWQAVGFFRTPADLTTGIAWDGKYLWVTGTYGDLYRMDVGGESKGGADEK